ncbi:hypothetical protein Pint_12307 [Pistacia integerrima]|uniref:Uncharacterized protein n=1 Tax=Pistacia integerrima TaxID=434235 RepID=A0ACC0XJ47_9ROSI|nr:hypothetical protein Pint_12307 [Pistacia integerrima]
MNRHKDIFKLIHEMGTLKDLIVASKDKKDNNILHSAGMLAPPDRLNVVSGAALQLQRELLWFKDNATPGSTSTEEKVEIVIAPPYKKLAELNVDVSRESSISMVLCGNVNQKQIGSSTREEEPVLVINSTSSSEDNERRIRHFKLYRAALKGDWNTAEKIYEEDKDYMAAKLSKEGDTALHIAAAARHTGFVKKLLEQMQMEDLTIKNNVGNTAFFLAAASGQVDIAEAMVEKHGDLVMIRGEDDMLPLHKAALMGNEEMVEYLYRATGCKLLDHDNDLIELLVSLINRRLYDVAFNLVRRHPELATAQDKNEETALHASVIENTSDMIETLYSAWGRRWVKEREKQRRNSKLDCRVQLKKRKKEWRRSLTWRSWMRLTGEETPDSAFDLVRIFHFAVLYRHQLVFKIIYEIGSLKDLVLQSKDNGGNNILHLAARLPPSDSPNIKSAGILAKLRGELPENCTSLYFLRNCQLNYIPNNWLDHGKIPV